MVQHAWSYCALCHDLLGMKLNRVSIDEESEGGGKPRQATYLHQGDPFWVGHIGAAFQAVASDVDRDLHEYREKMEANAARTRTQAAANRCPKPTRTPSRLRSPSQ